MESFNVTNIALLGTSLAIIYKFVIQPLFFSPLGKIPAAHFSSHISPLWIYYIRFSNIENETIYQLHQEKGPIIRLAPNELSINCYEEGLKTVYAGSFEKTAFYGRRFCNYGGYARLLSFTVRH